MTRMIRDYMSSNPISLDRKTTLLDAARSMRDSNIGDVLVTDKGRLFGILTDRDIVIRGIAEDLDPAEAPIGSVCSKNVKSLTPEHTIEDAVNLMRKHAVRRVPIARDGRPLGVLSIGDVVGALNPDTPLGQVSVAPANQ